MNPIRQLAEEKLQHIIQRYGDDNGRRLEPWYLEALEEEIMDEQISAIILSPVGVSV